MELQIGPHRIVHEDDVLIAHVNSRLKYADLRQILDLCEKTHAQFGSIYLVTIVGPAYDLPPDCRKLSVTWGREHVLTVNMIVGASFAMRTLIGLISRASKLMGSPSHEVEFAATEAEARLFIAKHKARK